MAIDQSFETNDGSLPIGKQDFIDPYYYYSQGFTVGVSSVLNQIDLYLKKQGTGGNNFQFAIYSDDGYGNPLTRLNDWTSINPVVISAVAFDWYTFNVNIPLPNLIIGGRYHIVMGRDGKEVNDYIYWGTDSAGGYARGKSFRTPEVATWYELTSDFNFRTRYTATYTPPTTVNTIPKKIDISLSI